MKALFLAVLLLAAPGAQARGFMNPIFPGASRPPQTARFGEARTVQTPSGSSLYLIQNDVPDAKGVTVFFHGNGETVEDLDYLLPHFRKAKLNLVLVEYPGYSRAPGAPSEASLKKTALEAYDWVKKEFPGQPVIAGGWSLGSAVAAYLASEREVKHVFLLSAMTSMKAVVQKLMPFVPTILLKGNEFDTTTVLSKIKAPVTLIHGAKDDLVPVSMSRELQSRLGEKAHLIEIPEASHNDLFSEGELQIRTAIDRMAGSPK